MENATLERDREARRGRRSASIGVVLAALVLLAAACSSGTSSPNAAAAPGLIGQAFQTVFSFTNKSVPVKLQAIEDGQSIKSSFTTAINSALATNTSGAKIDSVNLVSDSTCSSQKVTAPCAKVAYELLTPAGQTEFVPPPGYASYVNSKWLVSKKTVCYLLTLFLAASGAKGSPAGCAAS
jgi:hypothetical protein